MPYIQDRTVDTVSLINGEVIVTGDNIFIDSTVMYCVKQASGTQGHLSISNQANGTFTITSTSPTDQSSINIQIWG
jgi:hypothetical protein